VIAEHGLPWALYTARRSARTTEVLAGSQARASHYFYTPKAGEKVAKDQLTQVGRALAQLGIEHIPAYSPEARGRSERVFGTLQNRLLKELALAGITTLEAANRFIREIYLPDHNARFAEPPEHPETAFVADAAGLHRDILCVQEERVVGNDNTVRYRGLSLQIPPSPIRPHFVKVRVRVHDYPDGTLAIFHAWRSGATTEVAPGSQPRVVWPATEPMAGPSTTMRCWPPDAAGRPAPVDLWTSLRLAHQPHRPHHHSGQPMCYQHRST
jgi:hypothetical protein